MMNPRLKEQLAKSPKRDLLMGAFDDVIEEINDIRKMQDNELPGRRATVEIIEKYKRSLRILSGDLPGNPREEKEENDYV